MEGYPAGTVKFHYSARKPGDKKEYKISNHSIKIEEYRKSIKSVKAGRETREAERSKSIVLPKHIENIEFEFHDWFNAFDFEAKYRENFGISPIKYFDLNTKGIFAVIEGELFEKFIEELEKFINCTDHEKPNYNPDIKFIKKFRFHSTDRILDKFSVDEVIHLHIIDNIELSEITLEILQILKKFLKDKHITFKENEYANEIEITTALQDVILEIAQNFDIVHSINSSSYIISLLVNISL